MLISFFILIVFFHKLNILSEFSLSLDAIQHAESDK